MRSDEGGVRGGLGGSGRVWLRLEEGVGGWRVRDGEGGRRASVGEVMMVMKLDFLT